VRLDWGVLVRLKPTCKQGWITRKVRRQISVSKHLSPGVGWRTPEPQNTALTVTNPTGGGLTEAKTTATVFKRKIIHATLF